MSDSPLHSLQQRMRMKIPGAELVVTELPLVPQIQLMLIDKHYPQEQLSQDQATALMDEPPYWSFCWASGQVLAQYLLTHKELIQGKIVIDFGCGSGVVAIAAAMAGAQRIWAVDADRDALIASQMNAELNNVQLNCVASLDEISDSTKQAVMLVADVFYDADNLNLLSVFKRDYYDVLVADSRVKPEHLTGLTHCAQFESRTVPDLAESSDFNSVGIYQHRV